MESLGHLRHLIALAETGNFRKAGERLGVSHSAVSQIIKKLEDGYGVPLFERMRGKTVPTAFGDRLIASAQVAINEMEAAERDLGLMEDHSLGRLVVGADPSVSESLLSIPMTKLMNRFSSLQFTVKICNRDRWETRLKNREIDIYFGLQPDREIEELQYQKLTLQPPSLLCRKGHDLLECDEVTISDLRNYSVIGGDVPDWFLWRIMDAYPDAFDSLQQLRGTFLTSQDFGLLRQLLLQTNAIAILPKFIVHQELEGGQIQSIDLQDWPFNHGTISGVAAWLRERPLQPPAKRLLSEVEMVLNQSQRLTRKKVSI